MTLIDDIDALEKDVTPGPWKDAVSDSYGAWWQVDAPPHDDLRTTIGGYHPIARNMRSGDAEFCAVARNNWPAISKALRVTEAFMIELDRKTKAVVPGKFLTDMRQAFAELETK